MIVSLLLVGAGCAHRTYVGATYSGTTYSSGDSGYYYEPPTSKGAGARALKNDTEVTDYVSYNIVTPDAAAATTQGAGARALIGQPETVEIVQPETVTVYSSPGVGGGEVSGGTTIGSSGSFSRDDANFVREAMQMGMAEVRMGELAQQKALNSSLRDFGQMLVTDHKKSNDELQQIATQKQFTTTMSVSSKDQAMLDKLSSLEGPEFDRVCERDAVSGHEKAIKLFRHEADHGQDSDLRAFAQKTLPTLEQHLQQAKELKKEKSST
jgi:putative membrane protein